MNSRFLLLLPLLLATHACSSERTFTDSSGRTLVAELKAVENGKATIRRSDGRIFTLPLATLSEEDQAYVRKWKETRTAEQAASEAKAMAALRVAEQRRKIAAFCIGHHRKQVGNGECWTLAQQAFEASGATRPGDDLRVWGREIDFAKEPIEPGDIVEFRNASIPGYGITGEEHTAVVIKGGRRGKCTLAEQNWAGNKTVRHVPVDLGNLVAGKVIVYRPE